MTHTRIHIGVRISFFAMFIVIVVVVATLVVRIRSMTKHTGASLGIFAFLRSHSFPFIRITPTPTSPTPTTPTVASGGACCNGFFGGWVWYIVPTPTSSSMSGIVSATGLVVDGSRGGSRYRTSTSSRLFATD